MPAPCADTIGCVGRLRAVMVVSHREQAQPGSCSAPDARYGVVVPSGAGVSVVTGGTSVGVGVGAGIMVACWR